MDNAIEKLRIGKQYVDWHQCDQMLEVKVFQFFFKFAQNVATTVLT